MSEPTPYYSIYLGVQVDAAVAKTMTLASAAFLDAGVPNGVATLDSGGKVPTSQLPPAVVGAVDYQGTWNASSNTPGLASGTGTKGFYYKVSVAGTTLIDGVDEWNVGDWIVFNGATWDKVDNTEEDATGSVKGRVLLANDLGGTASSPVVEGLKGQPLPATVNGAFIKQKSDGSGWEEVGYGSDANTVCQGNDSRLSDTRTPSNNSILIKSDGSVNFAADQSMGSHKLTNLTDPASAQDAATKAYVDAHSGSVTFGTTSGTACEGNDSRVTGALQTSGGTMSGRITLGPVSTTQTAITYGSTAAIDFDVGADLTMALTGDWAPTTSNKGAGKMVTIKILADSSTRNFTWPGWIPLGAALPTSIAAGKTAILTLKCYGTTDASIVAVYAVQP